VDNQWYRRPTGRAAGWTWKEGSAIVTAKEKAAEVISRLPDNATVADIIGELYVQLKVEAGLRQLDESKGIEHSEAKGRLKKWLT